MNRNKKISMSGCIFIIGVFIFINLLLYRHIGYWSILSALVILSVASRPVKEGGCWLWEEYKIE